MSYNYVSGMYQTGDIILFSSQKYLISRLIEWWTGSDYSHVGIILVDPVWISPSLLGTFVWESGWQSFPDADNETKCTFGVRLTRIEDYIASYNGNIYVRKINKPLENNHFTILKILYDKYQHKPYDLEWFDWVRVAFDLPVGNIYQTDRFFCSAWVMFVLCRLNLLDSATHPWDLCQPKNLSSKYIDKCLHDYVYGPETLVK